ncbi:uncharacterized protein V1516DRAFT_686904 [Lipomyces oligophaga]|uniref:uncharacterized protein n=1 Tax=Lipomyces oligophaga TaxID=45792 RepID=UPI0034D00BD5
MARDKESAVTFVALNVDDDSDLSDNEEHIREIQIEEAFKLFQEALKAQYEKNWNLASNTYNELFKGEIFTADLSGVVPPALYSLKYLAYKNHGQLVLDWIKLSFNALNPSELQERLTQGVVELSEAMLYESDDTDFWLKIAAYLPALNLKRMTRFALECVVNDGTKALTTDDHMDNDIPLSLDDLASLFALYQLLLQLGDEEALSYPIFDRVKLMHYNSAVQNYIETNTQPPTWLRSLVKPDEPISSILENAGSAVVSLTTDERTWTSVGKVLVQFSTKRIDDPKSQQVIIHIDLPSIDSKEKQLTAKFESEESEETAVGENPEVVEAPELVEKFEDPVDLNSIDTKSLEDDQDQANKRKKRKSFVIEENAGERSSKRVRARAEEQSNTTAAGKSEENQFVELVDSIMEPFGITFGNVGKIASSSSVIKDSKSNLALGDFMHAISTFKEATAKVFIHGEGIQNPSSGASRILDLAISKDKTNIADSFTDNSGVEMFVEYVNNGQMCAEEVIFEWCKKLLSPQAEGVELYLSTVWPTGLIESMKRLTTIHFQFMRESITEILKYDSSQWTKYARLVQSYFEILLDDFIEYSQNNSSSKSAQSIISQYKERVTQWQVFVQDLLSNCDSEMVDDSLRIRLEWASIIFRQASGMAHDDLLEMFETFESTLCNINSEMKIVLPNCSYIPDISVESTKLQLSKIQAATLFAAVLSDKNEGSEDAKELLEALLCDRVATSNQSINVDVDIIKPFIDSSAVEFRLYLWSMIRRSYETLNQPQTAFECVLTMLRLAIGEITNDSYANQDRSRRIFLIFKSLFLVRELLSKATKKALEDSILANASPTSLENTMKSLMAVIRILHVYVSYEDLIIEAGSTVKEENNALFKCSMRFKDLICQCWCMLTYSSLLYVCLRARFAVSEGYDTYDNDTKLLQLLFALHEELGTREFCGAADGVFLMLLQQEIIRTDRPAETEYELLQCLHCRFGLTLGSEWFYPYDHKSESVAFDKANALALIEFVVSLAKRKRTAQNVPRSDMKSVLDKFCEVIGVPRRDQTAIYYNQAVIEQYLSRSISPMSLQNAFKGTETISTVRVTSDFSKIASIGLYFLQGQIYLTQYRSRKRTSASRTEDLDYAIRYFKHDLVCNTHRFESWYGLAQAYDSQLEDDMTWSAEKLNSAEQRRNLAATQRKSLLCYALAISLYMRHDGVEPSVGVLAVFFTDFGYALYSSVRPPCNMEAFSSLEFERHFSGSAGMYSRAVHHDLKPVIALKMALNMFRLGSKKDPNEWRNYFMEGKCLGKLEAEAELILDCYKNLILNHMPDKSSSSDPIFEPHYKYISVLFKLFKAEKISLSVAHHYLKLSTFYSEPTEPVNSNQDFYHLLIDSLGRLRAADKKHWHHRPTYRIAVIYDIGLGNTERAKEEISSFFALKAPKSFLSIWRPEYERAGRHFVYANRYTMYYTDLLCRTRDLESLQSLAKKLRRLSTIMVNHTETWDHLCKAIVSVIRELCEIPDRYVEQQITLLTVDEFFTNSQKLEYICTHLRPLPILVRHLMDTHELRKLNVGLAPTLGMEDLFASIYLMLYRQLPELEEQLKGTEAIGEPNNTRPGGPASTGQEHTELDSSGDEAQNTPPPSSSVQVPHTPGMDEQPQTTTSTPGSESHATLQTITTIPGLAATTKPRTSRMTKKEIISKANGLLKPIIASEALLSTQTSSASATASTTIPTGGHGGKSATPETIKVAGLTDESNSSLQPNAISSDSLDPSSTNVIHSSAHSRTNTSNSISEAAENPPSTE